MDKPDNFTSELAVLKEITGAIASSANINTVANIILDLSISYTNAEKGSLMLVNGQGELHILASRGINVAFSRTYKVAVGEGIVGRVAQNREAVLVEDIGQDSRFGDTGRDRYKTRSFISCPILSKGGLLGVININDKKDDTPFSENEFSLMKIIADQAAIALDNASKAPSTTSSRAAPIPLRNTGSFTPSSRRRRKSSSASSTTSWTSSARRTRQRS
jgi:GAF domain-containing protein